MKIAIIDLGSNSARMNIVEVSDYNAVILNDYRKVVRLSEGMGPEKILRPNAVKRTLDTLMDFKKIIDNTGVEKVRAIATAALRTAANPEVITTPLHKIGIDIEIISGEKEAYYDYLSVVNTLNVTDCLIMDIGGASTELIYVKNGVCTNVVSIPMAAVNITEKYFEGTEAKDFEIENAIESFTNEIKAVKWLKNVKNIDVIGLGGTIKSLANLQCKGEQLHGYTMKADFVYEKTLELAKMPLEQRLQLEGLGTGRADIIHGGIIPLISVMKYIHSPNLIACTVGLREGVMYDIIKK